MNAPGLKILAYEATPLGLLCLRQREAVGLPGTLIIEVTLNHEFLMSSYHTESERALASLALARREGDALDVLVGGLGLGYTAREVLRSSRVKRLEVVELLPPVIGWMRSGLLPLAAELTSDARLVLSQGDIYATLLAAPLCRRDAILIDVDHGPDAPLTERNLPFYTPAGLASAKLHLKPSGVLAVWSCDENEAFERALRDVFTRVQVQDVRFRNDLVEEDEANWIFLASD